MALSSWLPKLEQVWAFEHAKNDVVRAYPYDEFPENITDFPSCLNVIREVELEYSLGGPQIDSYSGYTEFHIVSDVNKAHMPFVQDFLHRIRNAAAANLTLSGTVEYFIVERIRGPLKLQYGSEDPHLGLIVEWVVKERTNDEYTVSATP